MKRTVRTLPSTRRALAAGIVAAVLAVPALRAQTAEEFKQLKTLVEQMQKTIEAQKPGLRS